MPHVTCAILCDISNMEIPYIMDHDEKRFKNKMWDSLIADLFSALYALRIQSDSYCMSRLKLKRKRMLKRSTTRESAFYIL